MVSETYIALVFNPTSIVYGKVQLTLRIDKTTTSIAYMFLCWLPRFGNLKVIEVK